MILTRHLFLINLLKKESSMTITNIPTMKPISLVHYYDAQRLMRVEQDLYQIITIGGTSASNAKSKALKDYQQLALMEHTR